MNKLVVLLLSFVVGLSVISGCSSQQTIPAPTKTTSSESWAFSFVVYNGDTYKVTTDTVTNIGKKIGEVTSSTDKEGDYSGNFSNRYPVGTKYYQIQGVDVKKSIAIEEENGIYVKADYQGKYN